jgi:hypothetical protein
LREIAASKKTSPALAGERSGQMGGNARRYTAETPARQRLFATGRHRIIAALNIISRISVLVPPTRKPGPTICMMFTRQIRVPNLIPSRK